MKRDHYIQAALTETQHEALRIIRDETKVPMAELVRQAVNLVIQKYAKESSDEVHM